MHFISLRIRPRSCGRFSCVTSGCRHATRASRASFTASRIKSQAKPEKDKSNKKSANDVRQQRLPRKSTMSFSLWAVFAKASKGTTRPHRAEPGLAFPAKRRTSWVLRLHSCRAVRPSPVTNLTESCCSSKHATDKKSKNFVLTAAKAWGAPRSSILRSRRSLTGPSVRAGLFAEEVPKG
jgi:hypothetical protein